MTELNIAFNYFESAKNLDPANIQTLYQANLIENLYSRILEYDSQGQLSCVLCNKFWIEDNYLYFEIKKGIKTKSGYELTSSDAQSSLKRLFDLNTNTHGNLLNFISSKNDIQIENDILKIKLIKAHYSQFFLPLIASMDFSIIPIISIDQNNTIIDHENTSGAYYVAKDNSEGNLILSANINHPLYSDKMSHNVNLIPTEAKDIVDHFIEEKYDVIDISNYPRYNTYEKLFKQTKKEYNSIKTIPINLFLLAVSPKAQKAFSNEQIFYALKTIEDKYLNFKTYGYGFEQSNEFIPKNGNGHLSIEQSKYIEQLRNNKIKPMFKTPISLGVMKNSYKKVAIAFKDHPEIQILSFDEDPSFLSVLKRPDIIIQTTDSSFNEDVSLLSYNFSMEYFGLTKEEGSRWIQEYINIEEKTERIKKLQEFHFNLLRKAIIYPIGASPYWAVSSKNLELNSPTLFPGSHWWKFRKK